jgi:hypothetical protein
MYRHKIKIKQPGTSNGLLGKQKKNAFNRDDLLLGRQ